MGRQTKPEAERARDIPPTGIRIPAELRSALEREALINGRTLSGEILRRLRASFGEPVPGQVLRTGEAGAAAPVYGGRPVTDAQRMLLALFDGMAPDKQLALLTVLKR